MVCQAYLSDAWDHRVYNRFMEESAYCEGDFQCRDMFDHEYGMTMHGSWNKDHCVVTDMKLSGYYLELQSH